MKFGLHLTGAVACAALIWGCGPGNEHEVDTTAATSVERRVDAVFSEINTDHTPGCALAVMKSGEIIYKNGYGMANLEYAIPIKSDTAFHVASISKQFTGFAVALLVEDGKVSWDDDIRQFIPDLPDYGETVTLRHMVHNISGVRDQWDLLSLAGWRLESDMVETKDGLRLIKRQRALNFSPGDRYRYSNSNFTLLAEVVRKVAGKTLKEFADERIFTPLRMNDTHFHDDSQHIVLRRAAAYAMIENADNFRISQPNFAIAGATSLFTTVDDMALWDRNFYSSQVGGADIVGAIGMRAVLNDGSVIDYARAMLHGKHRGLPTIGHSGADAGYRAQFIRYPEQEFSIALLCNGEELNPVDLAERVAEVYLEDQMEPTDSGGEIDVSPPDEASLVQTEGAYREVESNLPITASVVDGKFQLDINGYKLPLFPDGERTYTGETAYGTVRVEFFDIMQGKATKLRGHGQFVNISAERVSIEENPEAYKTYEGRYYSDELDTAYYVTLGENGALSLSFDRYQGLELKRAYADGFSFFDSMPHFLAFTRDSADKVNGIELSSGSTWKISAKRSF